MMQKICNVDELKDGIISRQVAGKKIAVAKQNGKVFAFDDRCTHADYPLSEGIIEGETVECLYHGSRFNLNTGKVLGLPATENLRVYKTETRGKEVFADI